MRLYSFRRDGAQLILTIDTVLQPDHHATFYFSALPNMDVLASAILHSEIHDWHYPHALVQKFVRDVLIPALPARDHEQTMLSAQAVWDWLDLQIMLHPADLVVS